MKLAYKDYIGTVEFSSDNNEFFGNVVSYLGKSCDVDEIYYGKEITELVTNFHKLIDENESKNSKRIK